MKKNDKQKADNQKETEMYDMKSNETTTPDDSFDRDTFLSGNAFKELAVLREAALLDGRNDTRGEIELQSLKRANHDLNANAEAMKAQNESLREHLTERNNEFVLPPVERIPTSQFLFRSPPNSDVDVEAMKAQNAESSSNDLTERNNEFVLPPLKRSKPVSKQDADVEAMKAQNAENSRESLSLTELSNEFVLPPLKRSKPASKPSADNEMELKVPDIDPRRML